MRLRFMFMPIILLMLIAGLFSGLGRLGLDTGISAFNPSIHGQLMIILLGFIISIERGAALGNPIGWCAPLLFTLGGAAQIIGSGLFPQVAITLGSMFLLAESIYIVRLHAASYTYLMTMAALLFLIGAITWLQASFSTSIPAWIGFLTLTIMSERMELSRIVFKPDIQKLFIVIGGLMFLTSILSIIHLNALILLGVILTVSGVWLLRYDVAWVGLGVEGLRRFMAINLLLGYVWLAFSGITWIVYPISRHPYLYDLALHSTFLGFIFHMIIAHAPLIIPSIFHGKIRYHGFFYLPTILLNISLGARTIGDLAIDVALRQTAGVINIIAVLLILPNILYVIVGR